MSPHGTYSRYTNGRCRCLPCKKANRNYARSRRYIVVAPERDDQLDGPWLLRDFPIALVARRAFPDDRAAIAAAFPEGAA